MVKRPHLQPQFYAQLYDRVDGILAERVTLDGRTLAE